MSSNTAAKRSGEGRSSRRSTKGSGGIGLSIRIGPKGLDFGVHGDGAAVYLVSTAFVVVAVCTGFGLLAHWLGAPVVVALLAAVLGLPTSGVLIWTNRKRLGLTVSYQRDLGYPTEPEAHRPDQASQPPRPGRPRQQDQLGQPGGGRQPRQPGRPGQVHQPGQHGPRRRRPRRSPERGSSSLPE